MARGRVMTEKKPTMRYTTYAAAPMTSSRQPQAAARSMPHGTCARAVLEGPLSIGVSTIPRPPRRSSRIAAHCCRRRPATRASRSRSVSPVPTASASSSLTRSH